jgi:hypothetical protein
MIKRSAANQVRIGRSTPRTVPTQSGDGLENIEKPIRLNNNLKKALADINVGPMRTSNGKKKFISL